MQTDSFRPVIFNIAIDLSSYNGAAPSDGAIDPTNIKRYGQVQTYTGSVTYTTLTAGDTFSINGVSMTVLTGATTLTNIVSLINAYTDSHRVVASQAASKLILNPAVMYENYGIQITSASSTVLSNLGMLAPVITFPHSAGPSSLAVSTAKTRAFDRWNTMVKFISEQNLMNIGNVSVTGGGISSQPTALSFNVTFQKLANVYTYDESNSNALLKGGPAIQRAVARALIHDQTKTLVVYDPTLYSGPTFALGDKALSVRVGALDSTLSSAAGKVVVTTVPGVR